MTEGSHMSNHETRLTKLERRIAPGCSNGLGFLRHDDNGNCLSVTVRGRKFEAQPGETEEALRARAIEAFPPFDHFLWVSFVPAKDGMPRPTHTADGRLLQ